MTTIKINHYNITVMNMLGELKILRKERVGGESGGEGDKEENDQGDGLGVGVGENILK